MRKYCGECKEYKELDYVGMDTDVDDDNRPCLVDVYKCLDCDAIFHEYPDGLVGFHYPEQTS